jgi:hypothetical protein
MLDLLDTISFRRISLALVIGIVGLALLGDVKGMVDAHISAQIAEERSKIILQVNENTLARYAKHRADTDSLTLAVEAAKTINGELVAALAIRIRPDTVYVALHSVPTLFDSVSGGVDRYASLRDTTSHGIEVEVDAYAPGEYSTPLQLGYKLNFPEQRPEIAFIETSDGVIASVSWLNQRFEVEAPFYRPVNANQKPLRLNAGALILSPQDFAPEYRVYLAPEYRPNANLAIFTPIGIGSQGVFFGVGVHKTLKSYDGFWDFVNPF